MRRSLCAAAALLGLLMVARGSRADRPSSAAPKPAATPSVVAIRLPPPLAYDRSPDAPTPVLFRHSTHCLEPTCASVCPVGVEDLAAFEERFLLAEAAVR